MIRSDQELAATQKRIAEFQRVLGQLRVTAVAEEFVSLSGGYRSEIEKMQAEVMDYLLRPEAAVA